MTDYSRPRPQPPTPSDATAALIRAYARQIAHLATGPAHPGTDALAAHLAHVALSYGRHGNTD